MRFPKLLIGAFALFAACTSGAAQEHMTPPVLPSSQQEQSGQEIPPEILEFFFGVPAQQAQPADDTIPADVLEKFYHDVWAMIGHRYYNPDALKDWGTWEHKYKGKLTTPEEMDKAVAEMVNSLGDRWTKYTPPDELEQRFFAGIFGVVHIGMQLDRQADGTYRVHAFAYGSPAHKSDLRIGDVIKSIGGKELKGLSEADVEQMLVDRAGIKRQVVYLDAGKEVPIEIQFERTPPALVEAKSLPGNIVYARLPHFANSRILTQLQNAISELQKQAGGEFDGLILDLRANPGGKFEFAVEGAHLFIEKGTIVTARTRRGRISNDLASVVSPALPHVVQSRTEDETKLATLLLKKPLVVLQDGSTASASEIVIGALKDNGRARIVGTTTLGKAVGYDQYRLDNEGVLTITELKYLTPKGTDIYQKGITPHVVAPQPRGSTDVQLEAGVKELMSLINQARGGKR